jgi:hypothetical protein
VRYLAAGLLLLAGVIPTSGAEELHSTLREASTGLKGPIERTEGAEDDRREALVDETLSTLRRDLMAAGIDEPLVRALVPGSRAADDESRIHPLARLRRQQRRLQRFADAVEKAPAAGRGDARTRLEAILAQPLFRKAVSEPGPLDRLRYWASRWLARAFRFMSSAVRANPWLAVGLFTLVVVAAIVAIGVLVSRSLRSGYTTPSREGPGRSELASADPLPTLLARAREAARAGRGVEALKLLATAATLALRARGTLPDEPGLTDREGIRILATTAPAEVRDDFRDLAELHDRGVYGGKGADRSIVERALGLVGRILSRRAETAS